MWEQQVVKYQEDRSKELRSPELSSRTLRSLSSTRQHLHLIRKTRQMCRLLLMLLERNWVLSLLWSSLIDCPLSEMLTRSSCSRKECSLRSATTTLFLRNTLVESMLSLLNNSKMLRLKMITKTKMKKLTMPMMNLYKKKMSKLFQMLRSILTQKIFLMKKKLDFNSLLLL